MLSWRILVNYDNRSGKTLPSAGSGIGAVAIRAPRGTEKPTYFKAGQTKRLFDLCGDPSPNYPDLLEAAYFLNFYPMWISAPSLISRYGGVLLTTTGSKILPGGVSAIPTSGTTITLYEKLGVGDGATVAFGKTIGPSTRYVANSARLVKNGVALAAGGNTGTTTETITGTGLTSASLIVATGVLTSTFTAAPAVGEIIEVSYSFNIAADLGVLFSRGPQLDYLGCQITAQDATTKKLTLTISGLNASGTYIPKGTYTFSFVVGSVDGFGKPDHILQIFDKNDWVVPYAIATTNTATVTVDAAIVAFGGGDRGTSMTVGSGNNAVIGPALATALAQFSQSRTYPADVFFDNTALSEVGTAFATLRGSGQMYSKYLLPMPNTDAATALTNPTAISDRGVKYFWNWGLVTNPYNSNGQGWTTLLGEVAKNECDNVMKAFGGKAVSWVIENGIGGQLVSGRVLEMANDPDEATLKLLDTAGINAIVMDPTFGVMVMSEKTSVKSLSDYSFGSYSGAIDYIIRNVVEQVIPFQLEKFNDDVHRDGVKRKCENIIQPMTLKPNNVIFAYAVKCDDQNNDETVLNNESFVLQIAIQVTRKSRTVVLTFIDAPAGIEITSVFA